MMFAYLRPREFVLLRRSALHLNYLARESVNIKVPGTVCIHEMFEDVIDRQREVDDLWEIATCGDYGRAEMFDSVRLSAVRNGHL